MPKRGSVNDNVNEPGEKAVAGCCKERTSPEPATCEVQASSLLVRAAGTKSVLGKWKLRVEQEIQTEFLRSESMFSPHSSTALPFSLYRH